MKFHRSVLISVAVSLIGVTAHSALLCDQVLYRVRNHLDQAVSGTIMVSSNAQGPRPTVNVGAQQLVDGEVQLVKNNGSGGAVIHLHAAIARREINCEVKFPYEGTHDAGVCSDAGSFLPKVQFDISLSHQNPSCTASVVPFFQE